MAAASHSQPGASVPESKDTETAEGLGFQSEKAKAKADAKAKAKAEKEAKKAANVCSAVFHSMSARFGCLPSHVLRGCGGSISRLQHEGRSRLPQRNQMKTTL